MKTPERILTEHTLGEITFDTGIPGTLYTVFSPDGFGDLVWYIRNLAYDIDAENPSSKLAELEKALRISDLHEDFRKLRFAMQQLKWTWSQRKTWLNLFCHTENLVCYESKNELKMALRWIYIRAIDASMQKCEFPSPTDWLSQSKVAAAREIAEFEEMVK